MAMTMKQIMQKTPQNRRIKSQTCILQREAKPKGTKYGTTIYRAKIRSTENSVGEPHARRTPSYIVSVETNGKQVVVACECDDFNYRWVYALWKKKAARATNEQQDPSDETNPRYIPGCCAHIYHYGSLLLKQKLVP